VYLLETIEAWASFLMEPLECRLLLSAATLPPMAGVPWVRDAGDGGVIVAGVWPDYTSLNIVRVTSTGALDPTFGHGGLIRLADADGIDQILVQTDGKLLVLTDPLQGAAPTLYRFNHDGRADQSFGSGGRFTLPDSCQGWGATMALSGDGRIVVASPSESAEGDRTDLMILRLGAEGQLDASFAAGGVVVRHYADELAAVSSIFISDAGEVSVNAYDWVGTADVFPRLRADGSFVASSGEEGVVTLPPAYGLLETPDDQIVSVDLINDGGGTNVLLHKFGIDGAPDPLFGEAGHASLHTGWAMLAMDPLLMSDRRIMLPFFTGNGIAGGEEIIAVNPDGSEDVNFADHGRLIFDDDASLVHSEMDFAQTRDGGLVEAHFTSPAADAPVEGLATPTQLVINRVGTDGRPIATFGVNGKIVLDIDPTGADVPVDDPAPESDPSTPPDAGSADEPSDVLVSDSADSGASGAVGAPEPAASEFFAESSNPDAPASLFDLSGDGSLLGQRDDSLFSI
jgi:uncharacterized delta-60 repeat protein